MSNAYLKAAASNLVKAAQEKLQNKNKLLQDADRLRRNTDAQINDIKKVVHRHETELVNSDPNDPHPRQIIDTARLNKEVHDVQDQTKATIAGMEQAAQVLEKEAQSLQQMARDLEMRA